MCIVKIIEIVNIINFVIVIIFLVMNFEWFNFNIWLEIVFVDKIKKNINN